MATTEQPLKVRVGILARTAAVAVIAGIFRWMSIDLINERVTERPVRQQALIVASVYGLLFAMCLFAAQFGWIGMLLFWIAVIVVVN